MLLSVWVDIARDLALVSAGERSSLRDPGLLEELEGVARDVPATDVAAFLDRLARAGELLARAHEEALAGARDRSSAQIQIARKIQLSTHRRGRLAT